LARGSTRRASPSRRPDGRDTDAPPDRRPALPRVWQGIDYRPLDDPTVARDLFSFAAAALPSAAEFDVRIGAWAEGARLVGAILAERAGDAALLHGPVVVHDADPIEIASQLVSAALEQVSRRGVETVFARPQGLDRVWVRFGFIPVPEVALPARLRERPGAGLFAYRDGSALWSTRSSAREASTQEPSGRDTGTA
jgi:predicted N-acetyltransferase YhbS